MSIPITSAAIACHCTGTGVNAQAAGSYVDYDPATGQETRTTADPDRVLAAITAELPPFEADERIERAIGVIYRPETERASHYFSARLAKQFDLVVHVDRTRALEPLEDPAILLLSQEGQPIARRGAARPATPGGLRRLRAAAGRGRERRGVWTLLGAAPPPPPPPPPPPARSGSRAGPSASVR